MLEKDEWANMKKYPVPKVSDSEFYQLLKPYVSYPRLGVKNFEAQTCEFSMTIDTAGKIESLDMVSAPNPMFDSIAIKAILKTSGYWKSGVSVVKKKPLEIHFPVEFTISSDSVKAYFRVYFFNGYHEFVTDSTTTFPALMVHSRIDDGDTTVTYRVNDCDIEMESDHEVFKPYFRLEYALDIDSTGTLTNIQQTINSIPYLDSLALVQLKSKKWLTAKKDGHPVPSYKLFSMYYTIKRYTYTWNGIYVTNSPRYDVREAKTAFQNQRYEYSLSKWNDAAVWYFKDPKIFYDKAVTEVKLKKFEKACDDFQHCYELCEQYGYPIELNPELITKILKENCE